MEKTVSSFAPLRNAKDFSQVLEFLAGENTAAIIEALRSDKWSEKLFPLYLNHPNHMIRYEIACSTRVNSGQLEQLKNDPEMVVRQAAKNNLMMRQSPAIEKADKEVSPEKKQQSSEKTKKGKRKLIRDKS